MEYPVNAIYDLSANNNMRTFEDKKFKSTIFGMIVY